MKRFRFVSSWALAASGVVALCFGVAGLLVGGTSAAAYRPFDHTYTDQDHHRNDILLPRSAPVQIVNPEFLTQAGLTTTLQILAVNDFHGNLEPPSGSSGRIATASGNVDAGGVEYLSTHIETLKQGHPNTIVVSAGDLIGASPFLSALFHDEPTINAWNALGLKYNAVGNHEFDEGSVELMRMQNGGCHPTDGCQAGQFAGAKFTFLGANVIDETTGKPFLPPYGIETYDGVKVAFVGVVTRTTPTIVSASGIKGLRFIDEAEGVNKVIPELKAQGVQAIVVLVHEGGNVTGLYNECAGLKGPIADIMQRLDEEVDVVISGHSHVGYNCAYTGRVLTQSASFGRLIGKIDLTLDRTTGEVTKATADNIIATRTVAKDAEYTELIGEYKTAAGPIGARPVGKITATIANKANELGENPLGDVIADAQLASTSAADKGAAVAAFMNPGGIRADLVAAADGTVTYEAAFLVQPFNNYLVTMTLTGAQIDTLLEQQWLGQTSPRILQISKSVSYAWDASKPDGQKVDIASIKINGSPISATGTYRVTVNSFLSDGGDNFVVLRDGTDKLFGELDIDAFERYLTQNAPVAAPALNRISAQGTAPSSGGAQQAGTPAPPRTGNGGTISSDGPASILLLFAGAVALAVSGRMLLSGRRR
ncbi:MAG: bifunctional UDP-sugar hydrolase/5'-nucleotidase [Dehalococcoidia bacterium]